MLEPAVIGADPSNAWIGLGLLRYGEGSLRERLLDARRIRVPHGERGADPWRAVHERVRPVLEEWLARYNIVAVGVERPGGGAHADAGPRNQAEVSEGVAWSGALVASAVGLAPYRFRSGVWRSTMSVLAAREGLLVVDPAAPRAAAPVAGARPRPPKVDRATQADVDAGRAKEATGFVVTWPGCSHVAWFCTYSALTSRPSAGCPDCEAAPAGPSPSKSTPADEITDGWKREAVRVARAFAPELVDRLVLEAEETAHGRKEAHRYEGVADACEALFVAAHAGQLRADGAAPGIW